MTTIADRLRYAMEYRNLKQADLCKMTGIGKSSISTYLAGHYEPKQKNLDKLAKALKVNVTWLMGQDAPMIGFRIDHTLTFPEETEEEKQYQREMDWLYWKELDENAFRQNEENREYWEEQNKKASPNGDLTALREQLRRQPGMRILFDASKGATEQDLLDAAALIEGFKKRRDGEE